MPGPAAIYAKVTLQCSSPQKEHFYNIFYYIPVEAPGFGDDPMSDSALLGQAIQAVIVAGLQDIMTVASHIDGTNTSLTKGGQVYDTTQILGVAGNVMGDELADVEAIVVQKRTATAGKSGRGRWYFGPVAETMTDENYLTAAAYLLAQVPAAAWLQNVMALGTTWIPCLYSKKANALHPLTSSWVDPKLGVLRGRKSHSIL